MTATLTERIEIVLEDVYNRTMTAEFLLDQYGDAGRAALARDFIEIGEVTGIVRTTALGRAWHQLRTNQRFIVDEIGYYS